MELLPGAPLVLQGGLVAVLLALVLTVVLAILKGALEPRSTSKRVEEVYEKRYESLRQAYLTSEEARVEALEVSRQSLETSQTILALLEDLRRQAFTGPGDGGS